MMQFQIYLYLFVFFFLFSSCCHDISVPVTLQEDPVLQVHLEGTTNIQNRQTKQYGFRRNPTQTFSHLLPTKKISEYSKQDFQKYAQENKLTKQQLLEWHTLYFYPQYIEYIKTFPEYPIYINNLHRTLQNRYQNSFITPVGKKFADIVALQAQLLDQIIIIQTMPEPVTGYCAPTTATQPKKLDLFERVLHKDTLVSLNCSKNQSSILVSDDMVQYQLAHINISPSKPYTIEQLHLQKEFKELAQNYAQSIVIHTHYNPIFKEAMAAGIQANSLNCTTIATKMAKFCKGMLKYVPAIVEGIEEALIDTGNAIINTIAHPLQSLNTAVESVIGWASVTNKVIQGTATLTFYALTDHDKFVARIDDIEQFVTTVCKQTIDYCKNTPPELLVKNGTYYITSLLLTKGINRCISAGAALLAKDTNIILTTFRRKYRPSHCLMLHDTTILKKKQRNIKTFKSKKGEQTVVNNCVEISVKALKVNNIKEFFILNDFGRLLGKHAVKTNYCFQSQPIYKLTKRLKNFDLDKGDHFYLDQLHKNHLEIFGKNRKLKWVLNLNGERDSLKTTAAKGAMLNLS